MSYEIVAVINDRKFILHVEGEDKDLCRQISRSALTVLMTRIDDLTLLEIKEG